MGMKTDSAAAVNSMVKADGMVMDSAARPLCAAKVGSAASAQHAEGATSMVEADFMAVENFTVVAGPMEGAAGS
jgi:hypothetical protein